ncbi:MAG: iron-containing alcohol dehydrogenase [Ruminiclostridium sp.]
MKKYGYLGKLEEQLKKANIEYVLFEKILPNPIKPHVMEGAQLAKDKGCDFVIGLGGGSSTMGCLFACDPVQLSHEDVVDIYEKSYR